MDVATAMISVAVETSAAVDATTASAMTSAAVDAAVAMTLATALGAALASASAAVETVEEQAGQGRAAKSRGEGPTTGRRRVGGGGKRQSRNGAVEG